ncbi:MAG: transposase [Culicoidibacterales bacterium]
MVNYKAKSHRGRAPRRQIWCLTMVDTSTSPALGYVACVANRKAETLLPIITSVVRPGSKILTDEFKAYDSLIHDPRYFLRRVCHKYNFVCPISGNHTQHVESFNNKLKLAIKKCKGIRPGTIQHFFLNLCGVKIAESIDLINYSNYLNFDFLNLWVFFT